MTIASTPTQDLDINKIVLLAYREAGLKGMYQNVSEPERLGALDMLETIVNGLGAECRFAKTVDERSIILVLNQYAYPMPTDCLDVIGTARYIDPLQTDVTRAVELPVNRIDRDQWEAITGKNAVGRPTMYYVHRGLASEPLEVRLWMIPGATEAGGTIRFQVHRLRATMLQGQKTPDFERYWQSFFIFELAHYLASAATRDATADRMERIAKEKLLKCRGASNQSTSAGFVMGHRTSWSSR
jgi:hypothetical protein